MKFLVLPDSFKGSISSSDFCEIAQKTLRKKPDDEVLSYPICDGEQAPGNSMLAYEKVEMALQLEKLGVNVIEAGFAAASVEDAESVRQIAEAIHKATVCSLSRCKKEDIDIAYQALKDADHARLHLFLATSPLHMTYKLQMTEEEVLQKIEESVSYAKTLFSEVQFSCEDATRSDNVQG